MDAHQAPGTVVVGHDTLRAVLGRIFIEAGSAEAEARAIADHLVEANLAGHDSHGIGMVPHYIENLRAGLLRPNTSLSVVVDSGPIAVVDGQSGYGQVIAGEAMRLGIEKARQHGIALVALRNSHHIGRVGAWGEMCAEAGFVSMHYVNAHGHDPIVAPFRGAEARFATNPYCCALPATGDRPMTVLDMATSKVALGKVRVALNKGEAVAPDTLIDRDGRPTTDPSVMYDRPRGALLPIGDHKGYGLALICELLGGALTGGGTSHPRHERSTNIVNNMLSVIIDPARVAGDVVFAAAAEEMMDYVTAARPADPDLPVLVPGDPERASRAERRANGVPVDETTWGQIVEVAESFGFTPDVGGGGR
jgi:uncharacterized oxidoreductase